MARKWSNRDLPGALHYVTGNVLNRLPIFRREDACLAFLEECQHLRYERPCKLAAFVVMPDHFHLIVNPRDGKIREWTGALKSLSAKRLVEIAPSHWFLKDQAAANDSRHQVWQESFKALPLWSNWMIWQKINYIIPIHCEQNWSVQSKITVGPAFALFIWKKQIRSYR